MRTASVASIPDGGVAAPPFVFPGKGEREILYPPRELQERLTRVGGRNIYGEPNFRIVWGWSRLTWLGGQFESDGSFEVGQRLEPKHLPENRWYVEAWYPAEMYGTPRSWKMAYETTVNGHKVEQLGPYPARGEYEYLTRIQTSDGKYAALTPTTIETIVNLVRRNQEMRHADKRARQFANHERKLKDDDARDDAILNDMPGTYKKPRVVVPANYGGSS